MAKNIWFYSGDITNSGGTERVAITIANELNKCEDFNVSIVSLVEKDEEPFFYVDETIPRYTIYDHVVRGTTHLPGIIRRTRKLIKKHDVDVLIDIDGILEMYTIPATAFLKTKVVSWEHYNYYQHPVVPYRKYTRKMAARWGAQIITLTDEDKGYYESNLKCRCPVTRIYNPIIWPDKNCEYDRASKTIISAGRLTYQKGFDMLVDIADMFIKNYPDWKWLILGIGEDYEMLDAKIKEKGLENQVILKGEVDNIEDYYSNAAMYVMTSRFEGLPMTLLETKPYKLPLVSFNCKTGPSELIEDGVNGYLVEEGDLKGLAKRIEELIVIPDIRYKFSQEAQYKLERFDYDSIINKWKELMLNI